MKEIMNKFNETKLYKVLKSSWLCLRFPFLYPRNRFDGKHHQYILRHILWKLHPKAITQMSVTTKVQKANDTTYRHSYFAFLSNQVILKKDLGILIIQNDIDKKEIELKEFINLEKFSVIGMEVIFSIAGAPIIQIYVKTIDVNDTTNYGSVGYKRIELITDKRYNFRYKLLKWIDEKILDNIFILPTYTELDAMEPGWRKAFGIQMCKDLRKQLWKEGNLFKYRITQIKEKWGELCWYDEEASKEVYKIIEKYENLSRNTCIVCGKPATKISAGWISPFCDKHFPKGSKVYQEKVNGNWQDINMEKQERFMIANRVQTPDGTILWSRHRHDYVAYDDANGEHYMLDGGPDILCWRSSINENAPAKLLQVFSDAPFEEIRQVMLRGTRDKDGDEIWIPLCKMNDLHLVGVLDYNENLGIRSKYDQFIEKEIEYRKEHNIHIADGKYNKEDGVNNIIKK